MNELSIEGKAKRYDEILEKFDVILNLNTVKESGTIFADDVRKIFPELNENDGEKIRKWIIGVLSTYEHDRDLRNAAIAWLEKQGEQILANSAKTCKDEQKPAEWSEEDEMIALSIEQVMNCASLLNIVPEKIDKIRTWLKSLKDRYTWKPSEEEMRALNYV